MEHDRTAIRNRLRRIEGQVRGVAKMVDDKRYCIDILTQLQAIRAGVARVEAEVLKQHAAGCVADAIASGDEDEQRTKFTELVDLIQRSRG